MENQVTIQSRRGGKTAAALNEAEKRIKDLEHENAVLTRALNVASKNRERAHRIIMAPVGTAFKDINMEGVEDRAVILSDGYIAYAREKIAKEGT